MKTYIAILDDAPYLVEFEAIDEGAAMQYAWHKIDGMVIRIVEKKITYTFTNVWEE